MDAEPQYNTGLRRAPKRRAQRHQCTYCGGSHPAGITCFRTLQLSRAVPLEREPSNGEYTGRARVRTIGAPVGAGDEASSRPIRVGDRFTLKSGTTTIVTITQVRSGNMNFTVKSPTRGTYRISRMKLVRDYRRVQG